MQGGIGIGVGRQVFDLGRISIQSDKGDTEIQFRRSLSNADINQGKNDRQAVHSINMPSLSATSDMTGDDFDASNVSKFKMIRDLSPKCLFGWSVTIRVIIVVVVVISFGRSFRIVTAACEQTLPGLTGSLLPIVKATSRPSVEEIL